MEYIQVFSEWLYAQQYPMEDVVSHLKWGLSLLLGTKEGEGEEEERGEREGGVVEPVLSVSVLEKAVQLHVKMAQLHGRGSQNHRESCLSGLAYCHLVWKVSSNSAFTTTGLPTCQPLWPTAGYSRGLQTVCVRKM